MPSPWCGSPRSWAPSETPDLVPLCHPIGLDRPSTSTSSRRPEVHGSRLRATVEARTGVEMEAMTGAAVGAVALYDMVKGLDRGAAIGPVRLLAKSGGKSGEWHR